MRVFDLRPDADLFEKLRAKFPYAVPRKFQADLANALYDYLGAGHRHMIIEAPTGLGKTGSVWAAVATYAEESKLRILWLTRTASQVTKVAEETGCLPVYGRRVVCIHEAVRLVDLRRFNAACRATRVAGRCVYYPGRPRAVKAKTVAELKEIGMRTTTCPYENLMVSLTSANAIAATHRQLDTVHLLLGRWRWPREKTILVLDEAQHPLREALEMRKDSLSLTTLKKAAREARRYGFEDLAEELDKAVEYYESALLKEGEAEVDDVLPRLDDLLVAGQEIQEKKLKDSIVPASHVLALADFKLSLRGGRPLLIREGERVRLESLADVKESLDRIYKGWAATVTLSATIDVEVLERVTGQEHILLRAGWPFAEDALRAIMIRGLTTKFEKRSEALIDDAAWLAKLARKIGRALVFLPSHEMVEKVAERIGDGDYLVEKATMSQDEIETIINAYMTQNKSLLTAFSSRTAEWRPAAEQYGGAVGVSIGDVAGLPVWGGSTKRRCASNRYSVCQTLD